MNIVNDTKIVKARKEHTCDFCNKKILKGEENKVTILKDGDIYSWRECYRCAEYVSELFELEDFRGEGMSQYDFVEHIRENHPDVAKEWWG